MEAFVVLVLLSLLAAVTVAIVRVRSLFAVVVLLSAFSFLMASVMLVLDAVDVAMTEAAVGAGISAVLFFSALHLTKTTEAPPRRGALLPLAVAAIVGAALVWGISDLPAFGIADTPLQVAGPDYVGRVPRETGIPNVVTAVLASYRGFDTLGETVVVFTAGIGVLVLLKRPRRRGEDAES